MAQPQHHRAYRNVQLHAFVHNMAHLTACSYGRASFGEAQEYGGMSHLCHQRKQTKPFRALLSNTIPLTRCRLGVPPTRLNGSTPGLQATATHVASDRWACCASFFGVRHWSLNPKGVVANCCIGYTSLHTLPPNGMLDDTQDPS